MLNRRMLRIKALQALYAFEQSKAANYSLGLKYLDEEFSEDGYDSSESQKEVAQEEIDVEDLSSQAKELYSNHLYKEDEISSSSVLVRDKTVEAIHLYHNNVAKDRRHFASNMLREAEKLGITYLSFLKLLEKLAEISTDFKRKNFVNNLLIRQLVDNDKLQNLYLQKGINWSEHYDTIRGWFREIINKDPEYTSYEGLSSPSLTEDKAAILNIVKKILFKNDIIQDFMADEDLYWAENKMIIKSLVIKTLKKVEKEEDEIAIRDVSYNWVDDKEFFTILYEETIDQEEFLEPVIADNSRNWEYDRIATIDKIILKMALSEMIRFQNIPVKVTINEYLEIAKSYSTPKSKQFINGVLDVTAKKLMAKGVIKKSGRGLIDNK